MDRSLAMGLSGVGSEKIHRFEKNAVASGIGFPRLYFFYIAGFPGSL